MNDTAIKRPKPPFDFEEAPELSDEMLARARPASEIHGDERAARMRRSRGRPVKADNERKQQVTLRLSPDVLEALRATGEGWQTRIDETLRAIFLSNIFRPNSSAPIVRQDGKLDLAATIEARVRAAGDQPLKKGATLFERMANLSRDAHTGELGVKDPKGPRARNPRGNKKRA
jgi:uncharacterized protein (DUF4415 family)